jgi:hypothetical protein
MYMAVSNVISLPSTITGSRCPVLLRFGGRTVAMIVGGKKIILGHEVDAEDKIN